MPVQAESRKRLGHSDADLHPSVPGSGKRKAALGASDTSKRSRLLASPRSDTSAPPSSPEDLTPDFSDDDDIYRPPREPRPAAAPRSSSFTNALIRAGSRSTRDSSLDKTRSQQHPAVPVVATPAAAPVIVKKQPGLLLQAAGKGLLNTTPTSALLAAAAAKRSSDAEFSELLRPKAPTISFGLYGGHLAIDENSEGGGGGLGGIAGLLRSTSSGSGHSAIEDGGPFVSLLSSKVN